MLCHLLQNKFIGVNYLCFIQVNWSFPEFSLDVFWFHCDQTVAKCKPVFTPLNYFRFKWLGNCFKWTYLLVPLIKKIRVWFQLRYNTNRLLIEYYSASLSVSFNHWQTKFHALPTIALSPFKFPEDQVALRVAYVPDRNIQVICYF